MYGEKTKFAGWKTISQASRILPSASWRDPFFTPSEKLSFSAAYTAAWFPARTPAASASNKGASPKRATRICDRSSSKRPGVIGCGQASDPRCASGSKGCRRRSKRSPGRRRSGSPIAMLCWWRQARTSEDRHRRRTRTAGLHLGHRSQGGNASQSAGQPAHWPLPE